MADDTTMTKEQIKEWRRSYGGGSVDCNALCDLALRGLDDRRDAERYRWLRDQRLSANVNFAMTMGWKPELLSAPQVDSAIDRAMEADHDR